MIGFCRLFQSTQIISKRLSLNSTKRSWSSSSTSLQNPIILKKAMVFAAGSFVTVMALTRSEDPTSSPINTSSTIYSPLPYIHCDEKRPDAEGKEKEKGEVVVVVDADQPDQMDEFKKHNIGMYENRIRNFSHPFKVFTYFASVVSRKKQWVTVASNNLPKTHHSSLES